MRSRCSRVKTPPKPSMHPLLWLTLLLLLAFMSRKSFAQSNSEAKKDFQAILTAVGDENPRIRAAQYEALSIKSAQLANLLSWTPTLSAVGSKSLPRYGLDLGDSAAFEARLNLFQFGGSLARIQEGRKARQQADIKTQVTVLETENQAAQLLFQWIELQRTLSSQKSLHESNRELVRVAQSRYQRGQLPFQEVEKAQLDVTNSEVQIRQAEVTLLNLKAQLEALLPGTSRLKDWPWLEAAKSAPRKVPKPLAERLNFRRLELETEIRSARSWSATTDLLPSLDFTTKWQTFEVNPLGAGEWISAIVLTIPIWDQGKSFSQRGATANQTRVSEEELETFRREEQAKLQTLDERREKLRQNLLAAIEGNEKARNLAKGSLARFQLGRTSVNDLLIDLERVFKSDTLLEQALRESHSLLLESCLSADERPSRCF